MLSQLPKTDTKTSPPSGVTSGGSRGYVLVNHRVTVIQTGGSLDVSLVELWDIDV